MTFGKMGTQRSSEIISTHCVHYFARVYGVKSVVCTFSKCHGTWMAPCGARCNKSSGIMHVPLQSEMFQLERLV